MLFIIIIIIISENTSGYLHCIYILLH